MAKKKSSKKVIDLNRPFKIEIISINSKDKIIHSIEYSCDGILKSAQITYLRVNQKSTIWEIKMIAKWLEKFHPNRTRILDNPDYLRLDSNSPDLMKI